MNKSGIDIAIKAPDLGINRTNIKKIDKSDKNTIAKNADLGIKSVNGIIGKDLDLSTSKTEVKKISKPNICRINS